MIGEKVLKGKSADVWRRLNRDVTPAGKPERGRGAVRGADRAWSGARSGARCGAWSGAQCGARTGRGAGRVLHRTLRAHCFLLHRVRSDRRVKPALDFFYHRLLSRLLK